MSDARAQEFRMEEERRDATVVLKLRGELDLASTDALTERLRELRDAGQPALLDLDDLAFMDSSGLRVVLLATEMSRAGGWRFAVTAGSAPVRRLFASAGVTDRLPIEPVR